MDRDSSATRTASQIAGSTPDRPRSGTLDLLREGFTADTLNILLTGDNRPGYRVSRLRHEFHTIRDGLSLNPIKFVHGLITIPWALAKGLIPDLMLIRELPAIIKQSPNWSFEHQVVNAMVVLVDSLEARGHIVAAVINTGDLVYDGRRPAHWERFLRITEPLTTRVPYFPVAGGHERTDTEDGGGGAPLQPIPPPAESARLFAEYKVAGSEVKPENVFTSQVFCFTHLRLWFGGGDFYSYAVDEDAKTTLMDKVEIDLQRYGIPEIDQFKRPIAPSEGPTDEENPDAEADSSDGEPDSVAAGEKLLEEPPPSGVPEQTR